ncbi:MAG: cupin domain-containing protein [Candidatus Zixiibacteriota bacterium]
MRIYRLDSTAEIVAGDGTRLRELLHPGRRYPFSGRYSLAHAVLPSGQRSRKHRLTGDEVYVILQGEGILHVDNESSPVSPMDVIEIPPGSIQWLENTGACELAFLCIVDPAWQVHDEKILE